MRTLLLTLLCWRVLAAESPPKTSPGDYGVQAQLKDAVLAADYNIRTLFAAGGPVAVADYLVVDVALFPVKGASLAVTASQFTLRLNGKKAALLAQTPGMVAASLKYPDWDQPRSLEARGSLGDAGVILGRPRASERFPGDSRPGRTRLPAPPRAPVPEDRSGIDRPPPVEPAEAVVEEALPEDLYRGPRHGSLFFHYKGKISNLKKVELLYDGPAGKAVLRLR